MTITDMHNTITDTLETLSDRIEDLISGYDDESDCPHLCKALGAVVSLSDTADTRFEQMNEALYLHLK